MIHGETIASGASAHCQKCEKTLHLEVLRSNAFYIGAQCYCGPYSRESGYYPTAKAAEEALTKGTFGR